MTVDSCNFGRGIAILWGSIGIFCSISHHFDWTRIDWIIVVGLLVQGRTLDTATLLTCATFSYTPLFVCVKLARTGHSWPKESLHALNRFVFCASPQHSFLKSSVTLSILSQSNSNWIPFWLGYHQPVFSKWFQTLPSINTPSRGTTCSCWPILC